MNIFFFQLNNASQHEIIALSLAPFFIIACGYNIISSIAGGMQELIRKNIIN